MWEVPPPPSEAAQGAGAPPEGEDGTDSLANGLPMSMSKDCKRVVVAVGDYIRWGLVERRDDRGWLWRTPLLESKPGHGGVEGR